MFKTLFLNSRENSLSLDSSIFNSNFFSIRPYSFDFKLLNDDVQSADKVPINADNLSKSADKVSKNADNLSAQYRLILNYVKENKKITSHQAELLLKVKQRRAREILSKMTQSGMLKKQGAYRSTIYVMNDRM